MDKETEEDGYLNGKLLLAMPGLEDPRFNKSVLYIFTHNKDGAMGIVINQPINAVNFEDLAEQMSIDLKKVKVDIPVLFGGPMELSRGFVLHSSDYIKDETILTKDGLAVTGTIDILKDIVSGKGPKNRLFALGYAGWGPGQLEEEIQSNSWAMVEADKNLIFNIDLNRKWNGAFAKLGIDPALISSTHGNA